MHIDKYEYIIYTHSCAHFYRPGNPKENPFFSLCQKNTPKFGSHSTELKPEKERCRPCPCCHYRNSHEADSNELPKCVKR